MIHQRSPYRVIGPERAEMVTADGVTLVADIWRPETDERLPVLLMRQPYGRAIASTVVFAHPAWYAANGYVVVIQDVRGCGDSGGDFDALAHEAADGAATLDWVATLPWGNGKIGTYGFSYQGITQYLALAGGGRRPDAMSPAMAPWSIRDDWAFEGNAFRKVLNIGWATQMAWLRATREGDTALAAELRRDADPARLSELLMSIGDRSPYAKWRADDPAYWPTISPDHLLRDTLLDIPVLHVGGWADYMLSGTIKADAAFRAVSPAKTHLVIGPWTHIPWNRSGGSADMGAAAEYSVDRAQLRFFDFYLKGRGEPPRAVELFDVGAKTWCGFDRPPAPPRITLNLGSSGLAATLLTDGLLSDQAAEKNADGFVHDPSSPAPLIGGPLGTPPGFANRARTDDRADVAVYTTAPFEPDAFVCGEIALVLNVAASSAPFDINATVSMVGPTGDAVVLCTKLSRFTEMPRELVTIALGSICATLPAGHALRLSLQGSGAPTFELTHPVAPSGQPRPNVITITHGGENGSRLVLPVGEAP